MNAGTTTPDWVQRRRFIPIVALALALMLAAFGMPHARAQGMMDGGGMDMMGRQAGVVPHHAPKALSQYGCLSCHAVDSGRVGPAFAWVAWKYHGKTRALARVSAFIEQGGTGSWGGAMPDLNVSPDQAARIAQWILSLPPQAPPGGSGRGTP